MSNTRTGRNRHNSAAASLRRRLGFEVLERRELLATLAIHWNAQEHGSPVYGPAVMAAGEAFGVAGTTEARYAVVDDATRVDAVYGPLPLAVATAVAGNESRALAVYAAGAVVDQFLAQQKQLFGVQDVASELVPHRVTTDLLGMTHLRYQQEYQGVPVYGADAVVHLDADGEVATANGRLVSGIALNATPRVSSSEAAALAEQLLRNDALSQGLETATLEPQVTATTLYVYNRGIIEGYDEPASHLVWQVHVENDSPLMDEFFYVDARTGELVDQSSGIQYAMNRQVWDDSARDWLGGVGSRLDYYDSVRDYTFGRSEGQPARGPNPIHGTSDVDQLYDFLDATYDFYKTKFQRDGADFHGGTNGSGTTWAQAYEMRQFRYPNAAYSSSNQIYFTPGMVTVDIVAHEYSHGVTNYSAKLVYKYESGALNESFSDLMGVMAARFAADTWAWLLFEDSAVEENGWFGSFRDLADPASRSLMRDGRPYPDRYHSPDFRIWDESRDFGGVHVNSLIPSHAAYLVAVGGTFNGYEIAALGCDKMEQIWYRAYTEYFTSTETFNDAYHDLIQAAKDLYGDADAEEVRKALQAVEMNLANPRLGIQEATVEKVVTATSLVDSVAVHFNQDMNIAGMLAAPVGDGSITSAVSLVNLQTGAVALDAAQFGYDSSTHTLTWSDSSSLPAGYYELQLRGDLLADANGTQLWGGTSGLRFIGSPSAAVAQAPALDAQGGLFVHTFYAAGPDDGPSVTIEQAGDQADPAKDAAIRYTVVFSEPVTGFGADDVVLTGTAPGRQVTDVSGDGTTYQVTVAVAGDGALRADIRAGAAEAAGGRASLPSSSTDNAVACDIERPTVTIKPAYNQPDPADLPARFTVVFSKPVTGFGAEDVLLSGTAPGAQVTELTGDGTTYEVTVDVAGNGTVTAEIAEGAAQDADGRLSARSTNTDNMVNMDLSPLTVIINQASYQSDPATAGEIRFTVEFSRPVGAGRWDPEYFLNRFEFEAHPADVVLSGTAPGMRLRGILGGYGELFPGYVARYEVIVAVDGPGTVTATVPAGAAEDFEHRWSEASTSTDNVVTIVDAMPPTVTISQAAGQADPTNQATIHFAVAFSKPVLDFDASDVTPGGTAGATLVEVTTADQMLFDVAVSGMAQDGTVTITVPAGAAHDADGAASLEPIIVDNSVTYDGTPPTATIEPAAGQSNPTNQNPVNFAAVFSEPVSDFTSGDVTLSGSAGATTAVVTGEGTTYNVAVSGMTGRGTVVVQIGADAAFDAAGNGNTAASGSVGGVLYSGWHNLDLACDVDGNGRVEALDVLTTINYINAHSGQTVLPPPPAGEHPYYDVNDDGACTAIDVLTVINWINAHPTGAGEGDAACLRLGLPVLPAGG